MPSFQSRPDARPAIIDSLDEICLWLIGPLILAIESRTIIRANVRFSVLNKFLIFILTILLLRKAIDLRQRAARRRSYTTLLVARYKMIITVVSVSVLRLCFGLR